MGVPIVVLGCRVRLDGDGADAVLLAGALSRRLDAAAAAYFEARDPETAVVVSGGRRWGHAVEADTMARELRRRGVPAGVIVRERCSLSTSDNARFTAALLARRGLRRAALVTCAWHMPRALAHFRRAGIEVAPLPSFGGPGGIASRVWQWGRERLLTWAFALAAGCSSGGAAARGRAESGPVAPDPLVAIARAEDQRRARDVPPEAQASHDPVVRRAAARAFARILDGEDASLLRALEDDDPQVVAWAAYGLGESCKGREDAHVRAVGARLASLIDGPAVDSMLRALGRCGGDAAEQTLREWLARTAGAQGSGEATAREDAEAAAFALGELSARRRAISAESATALLDAARGSPPLDQALYAFGRTEGPLGPDVRRRVAET
ncbi:MAG TPA: YdcF family protein, partial [Polyangiaceae bacterium]|nr:YdcF family protein [Polyangiaceae bacterium]